ncbi:hypothetical protein MHW47_18625 [Streptomyces sp. OfavH-34-F]|uniref:hypothetical protein n=1 Tax=Streptomyces sp. OfavH-34-F TaxID=2917760 RepID=UPI001EF1636F|nr:hypothetical protein [Streptomyces sp. OfavH-34-F]MCG7526453.1 hypothetical protein [Streptomyces sp. OfavH-34-F]
MRERTLEALGLGAAPREHPLTYPGAWPAGSGLLLGDTFLRLSPEPDTGLDRWPVEYGGPGSRVPLDEVLADAGAPPTGERTPVLAIGSNACPGQLRYKMAERGLSAVIPMVEVRVTGIEAGVSAHVSPLGYVSASPFHAPGRTRALFLTWLDGAQLEHVDRSEGVFLAQGAYDRIYLPADRFPVEMPNGELLNGVHAYAHRLGVLHDGTGAPWVHPGERRLLTELIARSPLLREWFGGTPEEFSARALGDPGLCERGTRLLRDEGLTLASGLESLVAAPGPSAPAGDGVPA